MLGSLEESDSKAGFYYDLKFLIIFAYVAFLILTILSRFMLQVRIDIISLVFLSFLFFLDLQEFVEIRVPRYGWKGSRSAYRVASVLLAMGILSVPIAGSLMDSDILAAVHGVIGIALFISTIGFLIVPVLGMLYYLTFVLNYAHQHNFSLWTRDKDIREAYSKHSFFYRKLSRRKKQI